MRFGGASPMLGFETAWNIAELDRPGYRAGYPGRARGGPVLSPPCHDGHRNQAIARAGRFAIGHQVRDVSGIAREPIQTELLSRNHSNIIKIYK